MLFACLGWYDLLSLPNLWVLVYIHVVAALHLIFMEP